MATRVDYVPLTLGEQVFRAGMYWRITYGTFRIALASFLLTLIGHPVADAYRRVLRVVLERDPSDHIFGSIAHFFSSHGYSVTYFLVAYFFFWGTVDIILSLAMLNHSLWAFPVSLVVITAFILYEVYRYSHTHSPILLTIIGIDIFLLYLIRSEYVKLRKKLETVTAPATLPPQRPQES